MSIERWDPFREMISLRDVMNSLVAESYLRPGARPTVGEAMTLPLDVTESEGEFVVKSSLPGVKPEDVQITVQGDTLTIRGESKAEEEKKGTHWHLRERRSGSFARSVSLGSPINSDAATAEFDHGVLTLRLPKAAENKPKQIKVATTSTPPASSEPPASYEPEGLPSGTGTGPVKQAASTKSSKKGGKPEPAHDLTAEQTREAQEAETARNAAVSSRERMVDIGRGNQQAGRQSQ